MIILIILLIFFLDDVRSLIVRRKLILVIALTYHSLIVFLVCLKKWSSSPFKLDEIFLNPPPPRLPVSLCGDMSDTFQLRFKVHLKPLIFVIRVRRPTSARVTESSPGFITLWMSWWCAEHIVSYWTILHSKWLRTGCFKNISKQNKTNKNYNKRKKVNPDSDSYALFVNNLRVVITPRDTCVSFGKLVNKQSGLTTKPFLSQSRMNSQFWRKRMQSALETA